MDPPDGYDEIIAIFGNPANANGTLDKAWEKKQILLVPPPDGWQLFYQDNGKLIRQSIRIHRLLKESFQAVLRDIWKFARTQLGGAATDDEIRVWLHTLRVDQHGGGFNFRPKTGNGELSLHAFGIAIDWDPLHNPRRSQQSTLPEWWYKIWHQHAWKDGRSFPTPDPMHVQFATGA